ncbi:MAG: transporter substrate-binding domain-containing protein [Proteobacteria bacterium]|nr:transporter substrate-binding domain-containing protein [Pseudomonadota bacterium]
MQSPSAEIVKSLAPRGRLRAAINRGNAVLVQSNPATGTLTGVTIDLARALGERLSVPVDHVVFDAAGKVFEALKRHEWDVAFLAVDLVRAAEIAFTAPYVIIEGNYMVRTDSLLKTGDEVDRAGNRIAVATGSAYELFLTRSIKAATLVRSPHGAGSMATFERDRLEVAAGVRQALQNYMASHTGLRILEPPFMAIHQAMGTPGDRRAGVEYLRSFVEEMKASGFIAESLKRAGQGDAAIAPPAP